VIPTGDAVPRVPQAVCQERYALTWFLNCVKALRTLHAENGASADLMSPLSEDSVSPSLRPFRHEAAEATAMPGDQPVHEIC
jgi:hypothetical protein